MLWFSNKSCETKTKVITVLYDWLRILVPLYHPMKRAGNHNQLQLNSQTVSTHAPPLLHVNALSPCCVVVLSVPFVTG